MFATISSRWSPASTGRIPNIARPSIVEVSLPRLDDVQADATPAQLGARGTHTRVCGATDRLQRPL
ncbi:hypothetical protein GCM10010306_095890 [Streptomyces umbrinus]|uniref:hypothetical protein n=1 Tax=Streptomyces umbrinus TaxID=67370 RepID=UPI0016746B61|nr:hypothetical protein [Streptomyces umbrinus]GHB85965.1 hypothetical protein GCM10010306_095890 [Streptomyces umbrinus]